MSVHDDVSVELARLGASGWQAAVALRLAEAVDESGTASAASLLGSLMGELAQENTRASNAVEEIIADYRQSLPANFIGAGSRHRRRHMPETPPESTPETPTTGLSGNPCVECGQPMEAQSGGRPRVRHPECRRTRRSSRT